MLPVNVDPGDDYFLEWFCQSVDREPVQLNETAVASAIGTQDFGLGLWFEGVGEQGRLPV